MLSEAVRFPVDASVYRRYEEFTDWEMTVKSPTMIDIGNQSTSRKVSRPTPVDIWCLAAILFLPLNNIIGFTVIGIHFNLIEFLVPLQAVLLILLMARSSFKIPTYQFYTGLILLILLCFQFLSIVFAHQLPLVEFIKIASGQIFIFLTYVFFSRVSPRLVPRYLEALVWVGGVVTVGSIGRWALRGDLRLDSPFWGRTNAFASALMILVLLGTVILIIFDRKNVLIPTGISFVGIILTQSRGAFMVLLLMLGLLWVVRAGWRGKMIAPILALLAIAILWWTIEIEAIRDHVNLLARIDHDVTALMNFIATGSEFDKREIMSGRIYVWESALETISQNPFWGSADRPIYAPQWAGSQPRLIDREGFSYHSWLLNITASYGYIGMVLNLLVLIVALSPYWKYRKRREAQLFAVVLGSLLMHGLIEPVFEGGFLAQNIPGLFFWMIAGLGYRVLTLPKECGVVPPRHRANRHKVLFKEPPGPRTCIAQTSND